jgi:hypothetical protein
MTRILTVSDLHCGNIAGLTPPRFNPQSEVDYKMYDYRKRLYEWVQKEIDAIRPIDICVCDGDAIDGKGTKTGGIEQITTDRTRQIDMAVDFLKWVDADEYHFTFGTGYHVGNEEDFENRMIAEFPGSTIEDICVLNVNGLILKWRHHIGSSSTWTGRTSPLLNQQIWDTIWSVDNEYERSDVQTFGHTHYFQAVTNKLGTAFTVPALQGLGGSSFGGRRLGGTIDFGFMQFDVNSKEDWTWRVHLLKQTPTVRNGALPETEVQ